MFRIALHYDQHADLKSGLCSSFSLCKHNLHLEYLHLPKRTVLVSVDTPVTRYHLAIFDNLQLKESFKD